MKITKDEIIKALVEVTEKYHATATSDISILRSQQAEAILKLIEEKQTNKTDNHE